MFLVNLVVEPDLRNLRCTYCWLTASEEYVVRAGDLLVPRGRTSQPARIVAEVAARVDALLARVKAAVLKVSGGEVVLLPEILDVVERRSSQFTKVQILTNGTAFDRIASRRLPQSKYCFQVSLDAHLPVGNVDRFGRAAERRTRELLGVLAALSAARYEVEINCVLTPGNLEQLVGFADYVRDSLPGATLFPFPARFTEPRFALGTGPDALDTLIERHAEWAGALPPRAYLEELRVAVRQGKRVPCHLPVVTTSLSEDGDIALCPCGDLGGRGNLFTGAEGELPPEDPRARDVAAFRHAKCRSCYTHFDVVNLFLAGAIPAAELAGCGIFRDPYVLAALVAERVRLTGRLAPWTRHGA